MELLQFLRKWDTHAIPIPVTKRIPELFNDGANRGPKTEPWGAQMNSRALFLRNRSAQFAKYHFTRRLYEILSAKKIWSRGLSKGWHWTSGQLVRRWKLDRFFYVPHRLGCLHWKIFDSTCIIWISSWLQLDHQLTAVGSSVGLHLDC